MNRSGYSRLFWLTLLIWLGAWAWYAWEFLGYPLDEAVPASGYGHIGSYAIAFALLYSVTALLIMRFRAWTRAMAVVVGLVIVLALALPPTRSPDPYAYLAMGKLWVQQGADPYALASERPQLGEWSARVPMVYSSPYGPLWTALFGFAAGVTDSVWVGILILKAVGLAAFGAAVIGIDRVMHAYRVEDNRRKRLLVLVALNPLLLQAALVDVSPDVLTLATLAWAMALSVRGRHLPAVAILVLGGLVKYVPWLMIPIPLVRMVVEKRWPSREDVTICLGGIAIAVLAYLPFRTFAFASSPTRDFYELIALDRMAFPGAWLLQQIGLEAAQVQTVGLILAVTILGYFMQQKQWSAAWVAPFGVLIYVAGVWVNPWYFLWLVPGAAAFGSAWFIWGIGTAGILASWVLAPLTLGFLVTGLALLGYPLRHKIQAWNGRLNEWVSNWSGIS